MKEEIFKTFGGSMRPLLKSGDEIVVKLQVYYEIGDVVLYTIEKTYFVHRIFKKYDSSYIVGDDNLTISKHVLYPDHVVGRVLGLNNNKSVRGFLFKMFSKGTRGILFSKISRKIFYWGRKYRKTTETRLPGLGGEERKRGSAIKEL